MIEMVAVLFCIATLAYVILSATVSFFDPYQTVQVYTDTVEDGVTVRAYIFREEERMAAGEGLVSYEVDETEKTAANSVVAIAYRSAQVLAQSQALQEKQLQYNRLSYALSDESLSGTSLDTAISESIKEIQSFSSLGDFSKLYDESETYKKLVLRREYLYGGDTAAQLGLASLSLSQELSEGEDALEDDVTIISTPVAGLFSSYVDGYEDIYLPELLTDCTVSDFQKLVSSLPNSNDGAVGKVASDFTWYMAMLVDEEDMSLFQSSYNVEVRISSLAIAMPMWVEDVSYAENGQALVVLGANKNLDSILTLRELDATVIFQSEEGIRVPKNAVRVLEDGTVGVYTVTGYQAEFKPVKVILEDGDDYIVVSNTISSSDKSILRSGDEVIITTAAIYEGKVVR